MRIGFTGNRDGGSSQQLESLRLILLDCAASEFHHGDCIGADAQAAEIASELVPAESVEVHPPDNDVLRAFAIRDGNRVRVPRPYRERNKDIVDASDALVAMPNGYEEAQWSGTWQTIRYARTQAIPIFIIWPDGTVTIECKSRLPQAVRDAINLRAQQV